MYSHSLYPHCTLNGPSQQQVVVPTERRKESGRALCDGMGPKSRPAPLYIFLQLARTPLKREDFPHSGLMDVRHMTAVFLYSLWKSYFLLQKADLAQKDDSPVTHAATLFTLPQLAHTLKGIMERRFPFPHNELMANDVWVSEESSGRVLSVPDLSLAASLPP
ncbi:hypothetical protein E2C01_086175 [Portunus trituberculatus]|uniref:Uncharacterized protein n=1 Tax=Portunus trituberculatus TaxID=210409 RepID=A0A5B7JAT6_PORTR|nr:hypothetical protein [Portunus trituberculatus]